MLCQSQGGGGGSGGNSYCYVRLDPECYNSGGERMGGYSQTRDTKYFHSVEAYWLVKTLVAQALEKAKED